MWSCLILINDFITIYIVILDHDVTIIYNKDSMILHICHYDPMITSMTQDDICPCYEIMVVLEDDLMDLRCSWSWCGDHICFAFTNADIPNHDLMFRTNHDFKMMILLWWSCYDPMIVPCIGWWYLVLSSCDHMPIHILIKSDSYD